MVSIADFVDVALYTVKRIEINDKVNFKTFKKDREVEIEKIDKGLFNVSENRIYKCTLDLINNNPHKIKKVRGYKYKGKTIYEYKIPLEAGLDCRVAYIFYKEEIIIFFISNIIIKNEFTKLVSKLKDVKKI